MTTYEEQLQDINNRLTKLGLDYKNVADWLQLSPSGAWLKLNGERKLDYDEMRDILNQLTVEEKVREAIQEVRENAVNTITGE